MQLALFPGNGARYVKHLDAPKGGPARLLGKGENLDGNTAIVFPDGNRWTKVAAGTPERKPKDLKTLGTKD